MIFLLHTIDWSFDTLSGNYIIQRLISIIARVIWIKCWFMDRKRELLINNIIEWEEYTKKTRHLIVSSIVKFMPNKDAYLILLNVLFSLYTFLILPYNWSVPPFPCPETRIWLTHNFAISVISCWTI